MKKWLTYLIIVSSAMAVGISGGVVIKRCFGPKDIDYSNFDPTVYEIDGDDLIERIEKYSGDGDIIDAFPSYEIVNYSMEKYRRFDQSYSFSRGVAYAPFVNQDIRSCQIKNGTQYFEESVSKSSFVGVAVRMNQNGKDSDITQYGVDDASDVYIDSPVCNYNTTPKNFSCQDYKKTYGRTLDKMFIYIIHKDTTLSSSYKKLENGYEITLSLDPIIAPYWYKFQMKNLSNLDKMPIFDDITLTYTLDKKLMLKKCYVDEKYAAKMGVEVSIHNTITFYYHPGEVREFPKLNECFDYSVVE